MAGAKKKSSGKKGFSWKWPVILCISFAIFFSGIAWWVIYKPNLKLEKSKQFFYIHSNESYEDVEEALKPILGSLQTFHWLSVYMEYPKKLKPGRYTLRNGMNNREIISLLRSGKQEPVKLVIRTYWLPDELAHVVSKNLEADSLDFIQQFSDSLYVSKFGMTPQTAMCIALPNTYYFNWNSNADSVINRLYREYIKFWTDERKHQADVLGLSKTEVVILASIVWREIAHADEMPRVAGVYLNRLRKNMLLQADPTVKFALQDFDLRRILNTHLETESYFNTYKYSGVPPGPICNPPASAIDAVLHAEDHDYIYFCAQPGNTGYHNFASTLSEHNKNAALFHKYLNSL